MKKILIVSPHFPPINAPDHQRVRMALPYFRKFGWDPTVITVHEDQVEGGRDEFLDKTYPEDIDIIKSKALPLWVTRKFGLGSLGLRAFPYLWCEGNRILGSRKFDLVFFSTTMFVTMALGQLWKKKFNVPYVLDLQDPWLSDYYKTQGAGQNPPGGKFKYGFSQVLARILEPMAMKGANHVICVSPAYPETLKKRYAWLKNEQFTVLPFGVPEQDFELLPKLGVQQKIFDPKDGKQHWVYVGVICSGMDFALRGMFKAMARERNRAPDQLNSIRMHFVGTSYAPGDSAKKVVEPIARELGIGDLVEEHASRVPYFEALKLLTDSDGIIIVGSDDSSYTASKIFPCIQAQRPILAIFHEQSSAVRILNECSGSEAVTFNSTTEPGELQERVARKIRGLLVSPQEQPGRINWPALKEFTALEMTRKLCRVFDEGIVGRR
jgi:hypothetical protein